MIAVKIELIQGGALPAKAHEDDAGWDCYARTVDTLPGGLVRCALGFKLELPEGWFADLRPRSSIWKAGLALTNSCGVVDAGYRGEVMAIFYPVGKKIVYPFVGDRIIQMMLRRLDPVEIVQVEKVDENTSRGTGGFGSTGR